MVMINMYLSIVLRFWRILLGIAKECDYTKGFLLTTPEIRLNWRGIRELAACCK
jgi:hypothetical protein